MDDPRQDDEPEDPWDGPSPDVPDKDRESEPKEEEIPPGPNELRIVTKIEEYVRISRGPRIQVIKSRDIKNAEHFSTKVFRVLKSRGYRIKELSPESLSGQPDNISPDSKVIYSINEATIREFLGSNLDTADKPMKYLFDNSMLSYLKGPVLVSTVSDEFYSKVGLQTFTSEAQHSVARQPKRIDKQVKSVSHVNKLAIYSFYFAAVSFALSAIDSLFGNYLYISYQGNQFLPIIFLMLVLSVIAVAIRSFSIVQESRGSIAVVVFSISMFIVFLFVGWYVSNFQPFSTNWINNLGYVLLNSFPNNIMVILIASVVFVLSLSRYTLFLGANSGKAAYVMSIGGSFLIVSAALTYYFPFITIFGQTVGIISSAGGVLLPITTVTQHFTFNPYEPFFGTGPSYYYIGGTAQYMLLRNWILFIANVLMSLSFVLAIKSQKSKETASSSV